MRRDSSMTSWTFSMMKMGTFLLLPASDALITITVLMLRSRTSTVGLIVIGVRRPLVISIWASILRHIVGEHVQILNNIFSTSWSRRLNFIARRPVSSATETQNWSHSSGYFSDAIIEIFRSKSWYLLGLSSSVSWQIGSIPWMFCSFQSNWSGMIAIPWSVNQPKVLFDSSIKPTIWAGSLAGWLPRRAIINLSPEHVIKIMTQSTSFNNEIDIKLFFPGFLKKLALLYYSRIPFDCIIFNSIIT